MQVQACPYINFLCFNFDYYKSLSYLYSCYTEIFLPYKYSFDSVLYCKSYLLVFEYLSMTTFSFIHSVLFVIEVCGPILTLMCQCSDPGLSWLWKRPESGSRMVGTVTWVKSDKTESCKKLSSWVQVVCRALSSWMFTGERIIEAGGVEDHIIRRVQSWAKCTGGGTSNLYGSWCITMFIGPSPFIWTWKARVASRRGNAAHSPQID